MSKYELSADWLEPNNKYTEICDELMNQIYGPKFCKHCDSFRPINVYILAGTFKTKMNGTELTASYEGSKICRTCYNFIEDEKDPTNGK